jgi:transmembrane 9 superfamily protein 3
MCKGIVGDVGENGEEYYIWTHKKLEIGYNGNKIVDVNLTSESKVKLTPNSKITFTYEVTLLKHPKRTGYF